MKKIMLLFSVLLVCIMAHAQVKIGDNPGTINPNSLLELESTNKGFLPPRVALNDPTNVAPLTGTVPAGMLVFSSGGLLADGYYYWNGGNWVIVGSTQMVSKTANAALLKTERFVLASNDINLTLPAITAIDNGLTITVKNVGAYNDHVNVLRNGSATIDGATSTALTRWVSKTFVANGGNWIVKEKTNQANNVYEVSETSSWTTIEEILTYLDEHMSGPSVIKLNSGDYEIDATQVIDLPYPLTIQGSSYGSANIMPGSGLSDAPLFRCISDCFFKMLAFDGTGFNALGEDAIQFEGDGLATPEYYEVKDCSFDGFNRALALESNVEVWVFEVDFDNAAVAGIEVVAGSASGATLKVSEADFTSCAKGIHLLSGSNAIVSIINSTFYNASGGVGITYVPASFTTFSSMFITNNAWNNIGTFATGFDFSLISGRDSKAFIQSNAGDPDRNPNCYINVINSSTTTGISTTWSKVNYNHLAASTSASMWTVANASGSVNRITYQPTNRRSGWFIISGNISDASPNRTVSLGVVKNGLSATRLGETTIRMASSGQPYPFSIVIYLSDIGPTDYFELYANDAGGASTMTLLDMQWYAETK